MKLTYIFHSGFVLETERTILVFDYWMDPANVMESVLQSEKPLYVFSSHFHEDHFTRDIFEWRKHKENITYILSKDILRHRRAGKTEADAWLAKGASWSDGLVSVKALGSTDSGVSWIVETEGKRIFHAGDLNNWYA
jgi:L-ascorbate metabolism protein UlaG (beta-lactamase superfamily)